VLVPVMQDSLKATTAKFNAEDLINNRDMAMQSLKELLSTRFAAFHVTVDAVSLTDFQFSTQFTQAIESKVTAQQNALAAQNQLAVVQFESQQQVIKAQAAATATVTTANAQANATVIAANAQAELQRLVNSQLTPEFLEYMKLKTWNGQLPQYMSGDNLPIWITTTNSTAP
jgi:prohibitin 2